MLFIASLAAFGTATCWALSAIISSTATRHFGAIRFARTRYLLVLGPMLLLAFVFGDWSNWTTEAFIFMGLSGLLGVFLGDTLLFAGHARLGPRLGSVVFSTAAPMTELLNWLVLGSSFNLLKLLGILVISTGVMTAIFFGKRHGPVHKLESLNGPLWIGLTVMLLSALCQAIGTIIAKPALDMGLDPFSGASWRVAISVLAYLALMVLVPTSWTRSEDHGPYTPKMTGLAALSGSLGMLIGMTLFIWALSIGDAGIVAAVASTAPLGAIADSLALDPPSADRRGLGRLRPGRSGRCNDCAQLGAKKTRL